MKTPKQSKRMKLPNGFGSIVKRTDKRRRKPYGVRKWIDGKQKMVGSFATYEEAIAYLVELNKDPSVFNVKDISFSEVYELMAAERYPRIAKATANNYRAAYKHCADLYEVKLNSIKTADLQRMINNMSANGVGYASQKKCKQLMHLIWNYAAKYDLLKVKDDITQYIEIDKHVKVFKKSPFNTRQIGRIQKLIDTDHELADYARCVIMMCYCGCRPMEFLKIKRIDVKLKQRYFVVRESKTEAGRDRAVPISRLTEKFFQYWMSKTPAKGVQTLIVDEKGKAFTYSKFRALFNKVMEAANCKHTPHECRHTCATWLDNAGANDVATKKILGHACQGVTKGVYTHKTLHDLKKAIDLIEKLGKSKS